MSSRKQSFSDCSGWRSLTISGRTLRLGTRGSRLALAQAENMKALVTASSPDTAVEIKVVKTSGDAGHRERLGAFVREIEYALLENEVDVALHCLKDLPTELVPGLVFAAHLKREDASDAWISSKGSFETISEGAMIGTGSLRRSSQLRAIRPDLRFKPLVGNVDTRLRHLMEGQYDAIILAIAGLKRLGIYDTWTSMEYRELKVELLPSSTMLPAPGQAVLVLQCREDDVEVLDLLQPFDHEPTRLCSTYERQVLAAMGGGCSMPIASFATIDANGFSVRGVVARPDGSEVLRCYEESPIADAPAATERAITSLLDQGARELLDRVLESSAK